VEGIIRLWFGLMIKVEIKEGISKRRKINKNNNILKNIRNQRLSKVLVLYKKI